MTMDSVVKPTIAVIGLGYVGLPVVCEFSKYFTIIAFDCEPKRVAQLKSNIDITETASYKRRNEINIKWTSDAFDLENANFFIVCVPTPVDNDNLPDLSCLLAATATIARYLKYGSTVVYESTVYPGTTENICQPKLEEYSNLKANVDFFIGFSPERLCPGDEIHSLVNTDKIIACSSSLGLENIHSIYHKIYINGLHLSSSIKSAEAAKVLENTQRDVNIALMNEVHELFQKDEIDTYEVLRLASSKWNFCNFVPGLVGGHCISVDPYYLINYASKMGLTLPLVTISRKVNEEKKNKILNIVFEFFKSKRISNPTITILGITYKENCTDLRNSKSLLLSEDLARKGYIVQLNDVKLIETFATDTIVENGLVTFEKLSKSDVLIICVAHDGYKRLKLADYKQIVKDNSLIIDVKNIISADMRSELLDSKINVIKG
ncbi:nucleotide sugar dehydrogenase [Kosakonia oryzendophytica]|uniref:nucleotide sugar dehydrogenase n=1 Tax=Kosakonia oryzendophytica TaxID=1005665 RepID=UPI003D3452C6